MKHKVNIENIPDKYKHLVKPEMTNNEVAFLGHIIMKDKIANLKHKLFGWYYERRNKKQNTE